MRGHLRLLLLPLLSLCLLCVVCVVPASALRVSPQTGSGDSQVLVSNGSSAGAPAAATTAKMVVRDDPGDRAKRPRDLSTEQRAERLPLSVVYMHIFKTGGTTLKTLLHECGVYFCKQQHNQWCSQSSLRASQRRRRSGRTEGKQEVRTYHRAFLDYTSWSRNTMCEHSTDPVVREKCLAGSKDASSKSILLQFPELESVPAQYWIVGGHMRFRDMPQSFLERDMRITSLREPSSCLLSSFLYIAAHDAGLARQLSNPGFAVDFVSKEIDKIAENAYYTGHIMWFCDILRDRSGRIRVANTPQIHDQLRACAEQSVERLQLFSVVGILSQWNNTLALLDDKLGHMCHAVIVDAKHAQAHHSHRRLQLQGRQRKAPRGARPQRKPPSSADVLPQHLNVAASTHLNQGVVSTNKILQTLPEHYQARLREITKYDRVLYDAAVKFNEQLMRELRAKRKARREKQMSNA